MSPMAPDCLEKFKNARLLVAGEVGIDEYLWGDTRRISPEAPVPVVEVESQDYKLGLSANVAQNIVSLGGKVTLVTIRGTDADGETLEEMIHECGIQKTYFVTDSTRPTLRKVRVIAQKQHVVRVDYERRHPLDTGVARQFNEVLCDLIPSCDGLIMQDYGKGVWNSETVTFIQQAQQHGKPVFVDPSRNSFLSLYRGVTLLTPNVSEAQILCGITNDVIHDAGKNDEHLGRLAKKILEETLAKHVVITCGPWGMVSLSEGQQALQRIPTFAREVYDVTGAGDTVIAVISLMTVCGYPLPHCMRVANAAAGIVVGQIGTASVTPEQLQEELERLDQIGLLRSD